VHKCTRSQHLISARQLWDILTPQFKIGVIEVFSSMIISSIAFPHCGHSVNGFNSLWWSLRSFKAAYNSFLFSDPIMYKSSFLFTDPILLIYIYARAYMYTIYYLQQSLQCGKYLYMRGAIPQNAKLCVSRPRNACHSSYFITYM
jgi:hypothetical protein